MDFAIQIPPRSEVVQVFRMPSQMLIQAWDGLPRSLLCAGEAEQEIPDQLPDPHEPEPVEPEMTAPRQMTSDVGTCWIMLGAVLLLCTFSLSVCLCCSFAKVLSTCVKSSQIWFCIPAALGTRPKRSGSALSTFDLPRPSHLLGVADRQG